MTECVTHVSEHLLPMSPVYTVLEGRGRMMSLIPRPSRTQGMPHLVLRQTDPQPSFG